ncbi:MAG: hypothetical protein N2204_01585 [Anaerolineae bacterium]|nr:hypothetical protein [Anaerolineae bacterium]
MSGFHMPAAADASSFNEGAGAADTGSSSAEVLRQLSQTLRALQRFKDRERDRLDPWAGCSLTVAEQALERAWLAFSQLHADLQGSKPGGSGERRIHA